jgi:alpha 1,6-mannosyltransferase
LIILTILSIFNYYTTSFLKAKPALPESESLPSTSTAALLLTSTSKPSIPSRIWYKIGPQGLSTEAQTWVQTCLATNPTYHATYLDDTTASLWVSASFTHRPDILETYHSLPFPILKADLLRYLLLYSEGGIWNDMDVSCSLEIPIDDWVPSEYKEDANLVVGWEFDVGWGSSFTREFATWTIMARAASPHLGKVIDDIVEMFRGKSEEYNLTISELTMEMIGDVVDSTGPRRMTRGIIKSLESSLNHNLDEKDRSLLKAPILVGDVLILPGLSFAASANHYPEGETIGQPLVTHHYASSWKNDIYGEKP